MNKPISNCCQSPMRVAGLGAETNYYVCLKCKKACDADNGKVNASADPVERSDKTAEEWAEHLASFYGGSFGVIHRNFKSAILSTIQLYAAQQTAHLESEIGELRKSNAMLESAVHGANQMMAGYDKEIDNLKAQLQILRVALENIMHTHMSCEQPTEAEEREVHRMFHIAEEALAQVKEQKA